MTAGWGTKMSFKWGMKRLEKGNNNFSMECFDNTLRGYASHFWYKIAKDKSRVLVYISKSSRAIVMYDIPYKA